MFKIFLAVVTLLAPTTLLAGEGEVCISVKGESTIHFMEKGLTNDRLYRCPSLGEVTIPQIYKKGWKVILITAGMHNAGTSSPQTFPQLLIEKDH